jgi:hypothetical protein
VLPHLLALPRGVVVGLAPGLEDACPALPLELLAFGPCADSAADFRHAVHRAPGRLVVCGGASPPSMVGAALAALRRAGAVVVLRSPDLGQLLEECERILVVGGGGLRWMSTGDVRANRCLMLRVSGAPEWLRVPLAGGSSAEEVLARFAAEGRRVGESRIVYQPVSPR